MTVQTDVSAGVTGSIPYEMGSRQSGFFGAVFWNPTNVFYEVTRVEFNASTATNQVFSRVEQGTGNSYPENGWVLDSSRKIVYLSGSFYVAPHSAIEFYVRIAGNRRTEIFQVQIRATANGTDYQKAYSTSQQATDSPFSVLWLGQGPIPQFVTNAVPSTEQTFYVTLQEDSKTTPINAEGIMTINVPAGFTNIADFGGLGWGSASIIGNKIEVSNTEALLGSYRTYAFTATTPSSKGLYQLDVSFDGTPKENPRGNFAIMVNDNSPTQIILQCDSYNPAQTRGWTKVGSSPYLNEIDYLSNYIHTSTRLAEEGYYGFQDSSSTEITSVFLDINGMTVRRNDVIRIRIYDGTTWIDLGSASLPTSFGWTSIDITSYLNTWGKINAAQLWFQFSATNNAGHVYVDCARLRVND